MVNAHFPSANSNSLTFLEDESTKRRFHEAGIGYFSEVGDEGVFEIYGGWGKGKISFDNRGSNTLDKFSSKFSRYFIQPSIGLTFKNFDFVYSLRYIHLKFYDLDTSKYVYETVVTGDQDLSQIDKNSYDFIESTITLRVGTKYVKAFLQVQKTGQLNSAKIEFLDLVYNFGIHINIAKRYQEEPIRSRLD